MYIRQYRCLAKKGNKGQRKSLYNDKRVSTSRRYNVNIYAPNRQVAKYIKQIE